MSKLFYDHLIILSDLEVEIKKIAETADEREELWQIVDEIIHHRILGCMLGYLPEHHHHEFLEKFHQAPHDEILFDYLKEKIGKDVELFIEKEINNLENELLQLIRVGNIDET